MERDGLLSVEGDRHLELSEDGRVMATRVMRKHRLAECLLVQVIGLPWEDVHAEACRWEHVMSEDVERRILEILGHPSVSPYGNPIPGLDELDETPVDADLSGLTTLDKVVRDDSTRVTVARIGEPIQNDAVLMGALRRAGATPGATVKVVASPGGVLVGSAGEYAELDSVTASHVFVAKG
jgi:DtxR family Mn-dependent transcriptional regulator